MRSRLSQTTPIKKMLPLTLLGIFLFGAIFLYARFVSNSTNSSTPPSLVNTGPTQKEKAIQSKVDAEQKANFANSTDANGNPISAPKNTNTTSTPSQTLSITAKQEGALVTVLTKAQAVANGNCTLTIDNGTKTITKSAPIIYQPDFSSCAGFSVPVSALGTGAWNIQITVTQSAGSLLNKSVILEVK